MMGGGLTTGTTTMILGPAGVGKSTISIQYVVSALERGTPAAVYSFDEIPETLFDRTEKLCFENIRKYADSGTLEAVRVNPADLSPGAFMNLVRTAVEERGVRALSSSIV